VSAVTVAAYGDNKLKAGVCALQERRCDATTILPDAYNTSLPRRDFSHEMGRAGSHGHAFVTKPFVGFNWEQFEATEALSVKRLRRELEIRAAGPFFDFCFGTVNVHHLAGRRFPRVVNFFQRESSLSPCRLTRGKNSRSVQPNFAFRFIDFLFVLKLISATVTRP
jgi:hypothetical protein